MAASAWRYHENDVLPLGLVAALALAPIPTPSAPEPLALRWKAPAGCPTEAHARDLVERVVSSPATGVRVVAAIDAAPGGFEGVLELETAADHHTRRLHADDCMVLARAMAVVIAARLDPLALAHAPAVATPRREPPRQPETAPLPARPAGSPSIPPRPPDIPRGDGAPPPLPPPRLELGARLGAGVSGRLLPVPGVGLSLGVFANASRAHLRATAQYWAPQAVRLDAQRDARGELQLATAGLRACPTLGSPSVRVLLCAGVDAGAMLGRGEGRDLVASRSAREPWVGAALEPGVEVRVTSRVALWAALEGVISLYRPRFAIEGATEAWTAGVGTVRASFGVSVHGRLDPSHNP